MSDSTDTDKSDRHRASTAGVSPVGEEVVLANTNPSWKNWNIPLLTALVVFVGGATLAVMGDSRVTEDITAIRDTTAIGEIPLIADIPPIEDVPLVWEIPSVEGLPFEDLLPVADLPLIGDSVLADGSILLATTGVMAAGILVASVYLLRKRQRYVVTDERVIKRTGLLHKSTGELRRDAISAIYTEASLLGRLLGRGTVIVEGRATDERLVFEGVSDYREFAARVRQMLSEQ